MEEQTKKGLRKGLVSLLGISVLFLGMGVKRADAYCRGYYEQNSNYIAKAEYSAPSGDLLLPVSAFAIWLARDKKNRLKR